MNYPTMAPPSQTVKIAACHAAPVYQDASATTAKALSLIDDAAAHGANLVVFPESFIPGFPLFASAVAPVDHGLAFTTFVKSSIYADGPEIAQLREKAKELNVVVSMGFSERSRISQGCLWNSNILIGDDGNILSHHRKLCPTFWEKLVWSPGDGDGLRVCPTDNSGRIGALICGENTNPLARYTMMAQDEQIHVATFPPAWPTRRSGGYKNKTANAVRGAAHSFEAKCFTVTCAGVLDTNTKKAVAAGDEEVFRIMDQTTQASTQFFGPDGVQFGDELSDQEGIAYAECDLNAGIEAKKIHDVVGGYQRPEPIENEKPKATLREQYLERKSPSSQPFPSLKSKSSHTSVRNTSHPTVPERKSSRPHASSVGSNAPSTSTTTPMTARSKKNKKRVRATSLSKPLPPTPPMQNLEIRKMESPVLSASSSIDSLPSLIESPRSRSSTDSSECSSTGAHSWANQPWMDSNPNFEYILEPKVYTPKPSPKSSHSSMMAPPRSTPQTPPPRSHRRRVTEPLGNHHVTSVHPAHRPQKSESESTNRGSIRRPKPAPLNLEPPVRPSLERNLSSAESIPIRLDLSSSTDSIPFAKSAKPITPQSPAPRGPPATARVESTQFKPERPQSKLTIVPPELDYLNPMDALSASSVEALNRAGSRAHDRRLDYLVPKPSRTDIPKANRILGVGIDYSPPCAA